MMGTRLHLPTVQILPNLVAQLVSLLPFKSTELDYAKLNSKMLKHLYATSKDFFALKAITASCFFGRPPFAPFAREALAFFPPLAPPSSEAVTARARFLMGELALTRPAIETCRSRSSSVMALPPKPNCNLPSSEVFKSENSGNIATGREILVRSANEITNERIGFDSILNPVACKSPKRELVGLSMPCFNTSSVTSTSL